MEENKGNNGTEDLNVSQATAPPDGDDRVDVGDPVTQLAAVTEDRDRIAAEKADLQDRLLRRQAEFDNYRRRVDREKAELWDEAAMRTVNGILGVLDDFERALKVETQDKEYARGMELIHVRLRESLERLGLEAVNSVGDRFDPNLHHAVDKAESEEHEEDTILDEYQKGYRFKGRMLRPAMVKVAVKP